VSENTWRYVVSFDRAMGEPDWGIRSLHEGPAVGRAWSVDPLGPHGDTWIELADDLARMSQAIASRLVLDLTADPPVLRDKGEMP
jgi:hypothetical protein